MLEGTPQTTLYMKFSVTHCLELHIPISSHYHLKCIFLPSKDVNVL
jgi:hypothetical protein